MNRHTIDIAMGSLPFHRGGALTPLIVAMLRIFKRSAGQLSIPMASIDATPIGLFAQTPPSTELDRVLGGVRIQERRGRRRCHRRVDRQCVARPKADFRRSSAREPNTTRGLRLKTIN